MTTKNSKSKTQIKLEKSGMTPAQARRHEQVVNTKESAALKLINETKHTLRKLDATDPVVILTQNLTDKLCGEIVRLRKDLLSEKHHRIRLANSIIPRLKSKCQEVRQLRIETGKTKTGSRATKRMIEIAKLRRELDHQTESNREIPEITTEHPSAFFDRASLEDDDFDLDKQFDDADKHEMVKLISRHGKTL